MAGARGRVAGSAAGLAFGAALSGHRERAQGVADVAGDALQRLPDAVGERAEAPRGRPGGLLDPVRHEQAVRRAEALEPALQAPDARVEAAREQARHPVGEVREVARRVQPGAAQGRPERPHRGLRRLAAALQDRLQRRLDRVAHERDRDADGRRAEVDPRLRVVPELRLRDVPHVQPDVRHVEQRVDAGDEAAGGADDRAGRALVGVVERAQHAVRRVLPARGLRAGGDVWSHASRRMVPTSDVSAGSEFLPEAAPRARSFRQTYTTPR